MSTLAPERQTSHTGNNDKVIHGACAQCHPLHTLKINVTVVKAVCGVEVVWDGIDDRANCENCRHIIDRLRHCPVCGAGG